MVDIAISKVNHNGIWCENFGHVNGDVEGANGAALLGPKNQ